jgi:hypothetical protein
MSKEKSISGGMTEREAMQILIDLQARDRASGIPMAPLNVAAELPQEYETAYDRLKRDHPGLTDAEIDELAALHGA